MSYLTPQIIAEVTGGQYIGEDFSRDAAVSGAVRDNREVKPGNLFVCIKGARVNGHSYADSAFEAGAACCLAEQTIPSAKGPYVLVGSTLTALKTLGGYYRRQFDIPIIGITGSVGKTTAKEMVSAVLREKYQVLKTPENLNNEIGVPLTLLSLDKNHETAVIEMGISEFGEMSRLADMVRPDICLMTKIGYSHLETLGDLNGVLRAKSEVYRFMKPDGIAVVCGDDELLREYNPGIKKITYGLGDSNAYRVKDIAAEGADCVKCTLVSARGAIPVTIPSYGTHLALAAAPAAAIGHLLGLTDDEIAHGVSAYAPVGGRANVSVKGGRTIINDCYNANPNSMREALLSLSRLQGVKTAILGDMLELGSESGKLHREIGAYAAECGIDNIICCGDKARQIFDGFAEVRPHGNALYFGSLEELRAGLQDIIPPRGNVLIKASHGMRFNELLSTF